MNRPNEFHQLNYSLCVICCENLSISHIFREYFPRQFACNDGALKYINQIKIEQTNIIILLIETNLIIGKLIIQWKHGPYETPFAPME